MKVHLVAQKCLQMPHKLPNWIEHTVEPITLPWNMNMLSLRKLFISLSLSLSSVSRFHWTILSQINTIYFRPTLLLFERNVTQLHYYQCACVCACVCDERLSSWLWRVYCFFSIFNASSNTDFKIQYSRNKSLINLHLQRDYREF